MFHWECQRGTSVTPYKPNFRCIITQMQFTRTLQSKVWMEVRVPTPYQLLMHQIYWFQRLGKLLAKIFVNLYVIARFTALVQTALSRFRWAILVSRLKKLKMKWILSIANEIFVRTFIVRLLCVKVFCVLWLRRFL